MNRKAFKLNEGDIAIKNNNIEIIEGPDEILQAIKQRIEISQGEWFLDLERGINMEPLKIKNYQIELIENSVIEAIKQDQRIDQVKIESIKIGRDRKLELKANVTTRKYGIIELEI